MKNRIKIVLVASAFAALVLVVHGIQSEGKRYAEDRRARMQSVREKLCRMAKENPGNVLPVKELFGYSLGGKVHDPNCQTGTFLNVEWNIRLSSNKDNAAFCISGTLTNGIASVRAANMLTESLKAKVEDHFGIKFKPLPSESLVYRHWYRWRGEHEELYFGTGKSQKVSEDFRTNNFYSVDIVLRDDKLNVF